MKVLQLGKFYPIRGGVEKVMWDVTAGLSAEGVDCDMLCASLDSDPEMTRTKRGSRKPMNARSSGSTVMGAS